MTFNTYTAAWSDHKQRGDMDKTWKHYQNILALLGHTLWLNVRWNYSRLCFALGVSDKLLLINKILFPFLSVDLLATIPLVLQVLLLVAAFIRGKVLPHNFNNFMKSQVPFHCLSEKLKEEGYNYRPSSKVFPTKNWLTYFSPSNIMASLITSMMWLITVLP